MRSILRATGLLASSSAITVLMGVASAKAAALLVGPAGVGYLGVLQSTIALGTLLAGMGLGSGLIRLGADAIGQQDTERARALRRATYTWCTVLGLTAVGVVVVFRRTIGTVVLHGAFGGWGVAAVAAGIFLMVAGAALTSDLNAHHRVGALAQYAVVNSVLGATVAVGSLYFLREGGIPLAAAGTAAVGCLVSLFLVRRHLPPVRGRPDRRRFQSASHALFRFGLPYQASMLVGTGVRLSLPIIVLTMLDATGVGCFRAATTMSIGYLGFLLNSMAQDYYPRVSEARTDAELRDLANTQMQLITLLGVPVILLAQVTTPFVVPLLYSSRFAPAVEVLNWQWLGDLFKLWAWTLSFIVLAHAGSRTFFLLELFGGVLLLGGSVGGLKLFGLAGLGMGYLLMTTCYFLLACLVVYRRIGFVPSVENLRGIAQGLGASVTLLVLARTSSLPIRLGAGSLLILLMGSRSFARLWRELRPAMARG